VTPCAFIYPIAMKTINKSVAIKSLNKCQQCGASSYKAVIKRDGQGVMRASGTYQCTGCRLVFATIDEWRTGGGEQTAGKNEQACSKAISGGTLG